MKHKSNKRKYFSLILLILIIFCVSKTEQQMTIFPENDLAWDRYFNNDLVDATVPNNQIMWAYTMGTTGYNDYYQGIPWLPTNNLCYKKSSHTTKATYSIGQVAANPSVDFTITNNKYLWDEFCVGDDLDGLYMPINIHSDSTAVTYSMRFYLMNPDSTDAEFTLSFETVENSAADENWIYDVEHPANVVVPAYSIMKYELRINIRNNGGNNNPVDAVNGGTLPNQNQGTIVYWLEDNNFGTQYDTHFNLWPPYAPTNTPNPAYPSFFRNTINTGSNVSSTPVTSYPANKPNMRLIMNYKVGKVAIAGLMIVSNSTGNSMVGNASCADSRICSDTRGCSGTNCNLNCGDTCRTCNAGGSNSNCLQCYQYSIPWSSKNQASGKCIIDHIDFTKLDDLEFDVPPAIHYTTTIEFWSWFHDSNQADTSNLNVNIIYHDFMNFGIHADPANGDNIRVICTPIDYLYQLSTYQPAYNKFVTNRTQFRSYITDSTSANYYDAFYMEKIHQNISSKWFHTRCAFSFKLGKAYLNDSAEYHLPIPQMYNNETNYSSYLKKFYRDGETVKFEIQNVSNHPKSIYFKNLNIYRDYIPQYMDNLKYFNLYKVTSYTTIPQLLWSAPFDDFDVISNSFSTYDFSRRIVTAKTPETQNPAITGTFGKPSWNFRRLNLLDPFIKYVETDLFPTQTIAISCANTNANVCFDDNQILNCNDTYYLDLINNLCQQQCNFNYMRMPVDNAYTTRAWCQLPCHANSFSCPYDNQNYMDITDFECQSGFITSYYSCIQENSQWADTALQVSSFFKTNEINIAFTGPNAYIVEVWIYPDMRFYGDFIPNGINDFAADQVAFMTNNFQATYNQAGAGDTLHYNWNGAGFANAINTNDRLNNKAWNHMILYVDFDGGYNVYYSYINQHYPDDPAPLVNGAGQAATSLSNIFFCSGETAGTIPQCQGVTWIDAYYKDLKVWDAQYANVWSVVNQKQFSKDTTISLVHYFPLTIQYSYYNYLIDKLNPTTIKGIVPYATAGKNPDQDNFFNFAAHYAYDELYPKTYLTTATINQYKRVTTATGNCANNVCSICYGPNNTQCLECENGYGFRSHECIATNPKYWYYKNPPNQPVPKVTLNVAAYNLQDTHALTMQFFIKIYTFTSDIDVTAGVYDLIIFDSTQNLKLEFNSNMTTLYGAIQLSYSSTLQYQYATYRGELFGRWIPISIAMLREWEAWKFPNMNQMTIYNTLMPRLDTALRAYNINEFTFPSTFVGLIADITFYKSYITNSWGIGKWYDNNANNMKYVLIQFDLKATSSSSFCLSSFELLSSTPEAIGVECVSDYNPFFDYNCGNNNNNCFNVDTNDEPACRCGCGCASGQCLRVGTGIAPDYQAVCSRLRETCDNRNRDYLGNQIFFTNGNSQIQCDNDNGLDFNRYQPGEVFGVNSPQNNSSYSIDFWWYSQSYVNENFDTFTITWRYHTRVQMSYNGTNFQVKCWPQAYETKPSNDSTTLDFGTSTVGGGDQTWRYFMCGVDLGVSTFFQTTNNNSNVATSFTKHLSVPTGTTGLYFKDTSPASMGVVYFRQLRLWDCFTCSLTYWRIQFDATSPLFYNVLHAYTGWNPNGTLTDQQNNANGTLTERLDWHGYNALAYIGGPIWCYETEFEYWNSNTNNCSVLFNLGRLDDIVIVDQPASRVNRWTMEVWAFVEENSNLTNGINLIYNLHVGMTLIRDKSNTSALATLCFPQEYIDDLNGKYGQDVFNLYSNALNAEQDSLDNSSSSWNFFRCAVDLTNEIMYLNDRPEKVLEPEFIFSTIQERRAYRHYAFSQYVDLSVENASLNQTRVFFKQWRIYREYMPQNTMKLKYKDMSNYVNLNAWPLVFVADFEPPGAPGQPGGVGADLYFWVVDVDGNPASATFQTYTGFTANDTNPTYTSYPNFYMLNLCGVAQTGDGNNNCVNITTPAGCNANTVFCLDNNERWWCWNNTYLDVVNLTCANNCPADFSRMPDSVDDGSYCRLDCVKFNYATCPITLANMNVSTYQDYITCNAGYTRAYYHCLDDSYVEKSAFYFSSLYSFTNMLVDYSAIGTTVTSYYLELWFMIDFLRQTEVLTVDNFYLLAPPHFIKKDSNDQLYKYGNYNLSAGTVLYTISSINEFEWNRLILHTKYNSYDNTFSIYIYSNYNFINADVSITGIDATLLPMDLKGIAFCDKPLATCQINTVTYNPKWGTAWYKNLRVWDDTLVSLYSIQQFNVSYTSTVKSMYFYYRFEIDAIRNEFVIDRLNNAYDMTCIWFYQIAAGQYYDNASRINYSIDFDYVQSNPGVYVSQIDDNTNEKETISCHNYCKRCYSTSQQNCYECKDGFALFGTTCYVASYYYFKTPTADTSVSKVKLLDSYNTTDLVFDISTQNPITITFWMRWYGIQYNTLLAGPDYPILYFHDTDSYIGFNNTNKGFIVKVEGNYAFENTKISEYIGIWTHFAISVYRSNDATVFPNMFNFHIQQAWQVPLLTFDVLNTPVKLNTITFDTSNVALFAHLRFYTNFIGGTYGKVTSSTIVISEELILEYRLLGSSVQNCLANSELGAGDVNTISLECIHDYSAYEDSTIQCDNDKKYFDVSLDYLNPPCELCDSTCLTQCFGGKNTECTCTFNSMLFWIETQSPPVSYNCYRVNSINWSFYDPIEINNLSVTDNDEMSIDFWVYIYTYTGFNFDYLDISWDKHVRVRIFNDGGTYKAMCFPYVDNSDFSVYPYSYDANFTEKSWFYVRCASDNYKKKYYINNLIEKSYPVALPLFTRDSTSSLIIKENVPTADWNYGFSFIRELKLMKNYPFQFWDPEYNYLEPSNYAYLLHYFRNQYIDGLDRITDEVKKTKTTLTLRSNLIGYNYVVDFTELTQCPEGQIYTSSLCKDFSSSKCRYSSDNVNTCLICKNNQFLNSDGKCYSSCPSLTYGDETLLQCRPCDSTCYTCSGKYYNSCTSCTGNLYLVKSLSVCIESCEEYGLTKSIYEANVCGPFTAKAKIINFNIEEPQNPNTFSKIEAQVYDSSANDFTVRWGFSSNETEIYNENNIYPEYVPSDLVTPFDGSLNILNTSTNITYVNTFPDFFDESFVYVFYLYVEKEGINGVVTVPIQFNVTMNDYPQNGTLSVLPEKGLDQTTAFLFKCSNWKDENTATADLRYKFTYYDSLGAEKTIKDFSSEFDTTKVFTLPEGMDEYKYTVSCYIKDEMTAVNSTNTTFTLTNNKDSYSDIVNDVINNNDFDETLEPFQYYVRTELLNSLAINFHSDKVIQNRTIIKPNSTGNLNKTDPTLDNDYCNNHGESMLFDRFLVCYCDGSYTGINCEISVSVSTALEKLYFTLWDGMKSTLTTDSTGYVIQGLFNLIDGASYFITNSDYMTVQLFEFIDLCKVRYTSDLISYYKTMLGYFSANLRYGTYNINKLKADNSDKNGYLRNITLSTTQKAALKNYYDTVRDNLESLITWYANNLPEATESLNYRSDLMLVNITYMTNDFIYNNYFSKAQDMYDPIFEMKSCLSDVMETKYSTKSYTLVQTVVNYFNSPFMYEDSYGYNAGNLMSINYYDSASKDKISVIDCLGNYVNLYFPVANYKLDDFLNNYRNRSDPSEQYTINDDIFSDPIYIKTTGEIDYDSVEDRRFKWWVPINFTCNYYDETDKEFSSNGCSYTNFTENYFHCKCEHLTSFVVDYFEIPVDWFTKTRFFYLARPELYKWKDNYISNAAMYAFIINFLLFIGVMIAFAFYDYYLRRLSNLLNYLKQQVVKINLPYIYNYNFNIGVIFSMQSINKGKRATFILDDHKRKNEKQSKYLENLHLTKDDNVIGSNNTNNNDNMNLKIDNYNMHDVDVLILGENLGQKKTEAKSKVEKQNVNDDAVKKRKEKEKDLMDQILNGDDIVIDDNNEDNLEDDIMDKPINPTTGGYINEFESEKQFNNFLNSDQEVVTYKNPKIVVNNKRINDDIDEGDEENLQELPLLNRDLNYEAILQEFAAAQLKGCEFFKHNLFRRHFLLSSLRYSLVYGRFRKIGLFCTYLNIIFCTLSVWFTYDAKMDISSSGFMSDISLIGMLVAYSLTTAIFASLMIYPLGAIYYINIQEFRDLYYVIVTNPGLKVFSKWEEIFKGKWLRTTIALLIQFLWFIISFYITFGFIAVYKVQMSTWILGLILTLIIDFFILEILWEGVLAFMFSIRKGSRLKLQVAEWLNRVRDMKILP